MTHLARFDPARSMSRSFTNGSTPGRRQEHWELIEGVAVIEARAARRPSTHRQQFEHHLNGARPRKPEWRADREIGIELSDDSPIAPSPDRGGGRRYRHDAPRRRPVLSYRRGAVRRAIVSASSPPSSTSTNHTRTTAGSWLSSRSVDATIHERRDDGGWAIAPVEPRFRSSDLRRDRRGLSPLAISTGIRTLTRPTAVTSVRSDHASREQDRPRHRRGPGFGLGIAETFAREGARVVVLDIARDGGSRGRERIGAGAVRARLRRRQMARMSTRAVERCARRASAASTSSSTTPARPTATSRCST